MRNEYRDSFRKVMQNREEGSIISGRPSSSEYRASKKPERADDNVFDEDFD